MFNSKVPYETALDDAFNELDSNSSRGMASMNDSMKELGLDLKNINSFEMLVFPKIIDHHVKRGKPVALDQSKIKSMSRQERKEYFESKMTYYEPYVYNFKVLAKGKCRKLKKRKKYHTNKFFGGDTFRKGQRCFVVEGRKKRPKFFGKFFAEIKKEDLLAVRLYLDDQFRPHGQALDIAVKSGMKKFRTVNLKNDSSENSSSGLSLFPVDLPNLSINQVNSVQSGAVRLPRNLFVIFKIKSQVKTPICSKGYQLDFKDIYGSSIMVDWCKGNNWPTTINTNRFFAILK